MESKQSTGRTVVFFNTTSRVYEITFNQNANASVNDFGWKPAGRATSKEAAELRAAFVRSENPEHEFITDATGYDIGMPARCQVCNQKGH